MVVCCLTAENQRPTPRSRISRSFAAHVGFDGSRFERFKSYIAVLLSMNATSPTRHVRGEDMLKRKETDRIDQDPRGRSFQEECRKKSVDRDGFLIIYSVLPSWDLGLLALQSDSPRAVGNGLTGRSFVGLPMATAATLTASITKSALIVLSRWN